MRVTTIGTFSDRLKNETIINELRASGIADNEISSIYINEDGNLKDEQTGEKIEDGTIKGATAGAVVGAIAGLVVANGILPGLGTVIVAGPLLANIFGLGAAAATTIGGAVTGAVAGGILGAFTELGVSAEDAKIYETSLAEGDVVIITRTDKSTAKDILIKNGANNIREYIED
jgi:hypothetical protein